MGKQAIIKTKITDNSVEEYIASIEHEQQRKDCHVLIEMMQKITHEKPKLWSNSMIGFGEIIVKSPKTGREVAWLRIGFAPRKSKFSLYLTGDINHYSEELKQLGKHKTGMGCLYINKLSDVDLAVLERLITKTATEPRVEKL